MSYKLATEVTEARKEWSKQKFLMIGGSGIGKSTFFSFAEDVGYMQTEAGLEFITAKKNVCHNWADVCGCMGALLQSAKDGKFPYKLLVIDTVDRIVDYATESALDWAKAKYQKTEIRAINDIPNGAGWDIRRRNVDKLLRGLEQLPCAVALIGHLENKKVEDDGQKAYDKHTISIGGKVGGDILAWSDHTLHVKGVMMGDVLKRTVYTKPTKSREAKSRGGIVKDGWVWEDNDEENFLQLRKQFD